LPLNKSLFTGAVAELLHENDQAIKSYEFALKHNPYCFEALKHLGNIFYSMGKTDEVHILFIKNRVIICTHFTLTNKIILILYDIKKK